MTAPHGCRARPDPQHAAPAVPTLVGTFQFPVRRVVLGAGELTVVCLYVHDECLMHYACSRRAKIRLNETHETREHEDGARCHEYRNELQRHWRNIAAQVRLDPGERRHSL